MSKNDRIVSLDLVRLFSCICVMICHFNASACGWDNGLVYPQNSILPSFYFENRLYIGDIGVSLFFMLSGASLMLTYKPNNLRQYYRKRILAIYPMFWIAWFTTTAIDFLRVKGISGSNIVWLLVSLLGMDGYLGTQGITAAFAFYKVGEWFLGCILLLYLIFPLIHWCFRKTPLLTFLGASLVSVSCMQGISFPGFMINNNTFWVRIPEIMLGMFLIKYNMRRKPVLLLGISGVCAVMAALMRNRIPGLLLCIAMCTLLFAILVVIGEMITSNRIKSILVQIGGLTYPIFLTHHWISEWLIVGFDRATMSRRSVLFLFLLFVMLTVSFSKLLILIQKRIVRK